MDGNRQQETGRERQVERETAGDKGGAREKSESETDGNRQQERLGTR